MNKDIEDQEVLEKLHKEEEKPDLKSILNKKNLSKWEMDDAFMGEI